MNECNLSKRLLKVASYIPIGARLADIGSDHAYLPCYSLKNGIIVYAIAGELNDGPYRSAKDQVERLHFQSKIEVRKGNGLQVIKRDEVDTITIAGMGGALISAILEEGKDKLIGVKRLILQPNVASDQVRIWLEKNNWILIEEDILEEDGVIYEILVAEGNGTSPYMKEQYELQLLLGPYLLKEKSEVFNKKWMQELQSWRKILEQLNKASASKEILEKKKIIIEKIEKVEGVLK